MITISNISKYDCDVLIVGTGPGGSALSIHLARQNIDVLLIDSQNFPRDKVCGDFVSPLAILELQKLGIACLDDFPKTNLINRAALFLNGDEIINRPIPKVTGMPYYGRVIPRIILDEWIFRKAVNVKTKTLENTKLKNFIINTEGVIAEVISKGKPKIIRSKIIIGADGSNSTVARIYNEKKQSNFNKILAVRAYFENINGPDDQCDLYFTQKSFPGYHWVFPTGNGNANIGIGMVMETLPKNETHLKELLTSLIENDKGLSKRIGKGKAIGKIAGFPLSTYNPQNNIIDDRLLLLGDAAGLINSLNGEGIQYALLSARWASDTIINCVNENDFSKDALQPYDEIIENELRYDLTLSNMIIQFIRNRTLNPIWMQLLGILVDRAKVDENYAEIAGGILAGLQPANKAINPNFIISTITQGIIHVGFSTAKGLVNGPRHWAKQGQYSSQYVKKFTKDIQSNPKAYLAWLKGISKHSVELSSHVIKDVKNKVFNP
jgi:geranylgeranyl reductase family protein